MILCCLLSISNLAVDEVTTTVEPTTSTDATAEPTPMPDYEKSSNFWCNQQNICVLKFSEGPRFATTVDSETFEIKSIFYSFVF